MYSDIIHKVVTYLLEKSILYNVMYSLHTQISLKIVDCIERDRVCMINCIRVQQSSQRSSVNMYISSKLAM